MGNIIQPEKALMNAHPEEILVLLESAHRLYVATRNLINQAIANGYDPQELIVTICSFEPESIVRETYFASTHISKKNELPPHGMVNDNI